jgi:hypothetical protein
MVSTTVARQKYRFHGVENRKIAKRLFEERGKVRNSSIWHRFNTGTNTVAPYAVFFRYFREHGKVKGTKGKFFTQLTLHRWDVSCWFFKNHPQASYS